MTVAIKFCGGARTVTGSMHLVSTNHSNVILDCGLFQGRRDEYYEINTNFPFHPRNLDACILSHAHIDHCGNIPNLIKQGFRSRIHSTPATRDLCRYMLPDSGYIQEADIKYVNKINRKRGLPPRKPLYTKKEAAMALRYFRPVDYYDNFSVTKDIDLTFYEAGHILGSAIPVLEVKTGRENMRIAYAVDLGRKGMPLLRDPEVPRNIDYLIIESTYGGREHGDIKKAEDILARTITKTVKRGGKIIIPSFALERTQLIVYFINELIKRRKVPRLPMYVDGPLAVNLTSVFRSNWKYFDEMTQMAFLKNDNPLGYDHITYVKHVQQSKQLNTSKKPCIIISGSGMCENGRILHHLKNNIENPRNTIVIIGYTAQNTLSRRIVEGDDIVRIFGRPYDLKAEVVVMDAFSSHADGSDLVEFVGSCVRTLKKVFIVHGDPEQSEVLMRRLRKRLNIKPLIPAKGAIVHLAAR